MYWAPGDQLLGAPSFTAKFGVVMGDEGQREAFHGSRADAGPCAQSGSEFYEKASAPQVPSLYSCNSSYAGEAACDESSVCTRPATPCSAPAPSSAPSAPQAVAPSASCVGAGGRRQLGHPSDSSGNELNSDCDPAASESSSGAVVAAAVGACVAILLALGLAVTRAWRRHRQRHPRNMAQGKDPTKVAALAPSSCVCIGSTVTTASACADVVQR